MSGVTLLGHHLKRHCLWLFVTGCLGLGADVRAALLGNSFFEVTRISSQSAECAKTLLAATDGLRVLQDALMEQGYSADFSELSSPKALPTVDIKSLRESLAAIPLSLQGPEMRLIISGTQVTQVLGLRFTSKESWFRFLWTDAHQDFRRLSLSIVRLTDLRLEPSDLTHIDRISHIETLWINKNRALNQIGTDFFNLLPNLKELNASYCDISIAHLARSHLADTLEVLLAAGGNAAASDSHSLLAFRQLKRLDYDIDRMNPLVISQIGQRPGFDFRNSSLRAKGSRSEDVERRLNLP